MANNQNTLSRFSTGRSGSQGTSSRQDKPISLGPGGNTLTGMPQTNRSRGLATRSPSTNRGSGGTPNPFQSFRNIRNPRQEGRIQGMSEQFSQTQESNRDDLRDFVDRFLTQSQRTLPQEVEHVGRFFDPDGLEAELAGLREDRTSALRGVADRALDFANRRLSTEALQRGGGASSFLNQQALDMARGIETDRALSEADQRRRDLEFLEQARNQLLGQRDDLLTRSAMRPIEARNQVLEAALQQLGAFGDIESANAFEFIGRPRISRTAGLPIV